MSYNIICLSVKQKDFQVPTCLYNTANTVKWNEIMADGSGYSLASSLQAWFTNTKSLIGP